MRARLCYRNCAYACGCTYVPACVLFKNQHAFMLISSYICINMLTFGHTPIQMCTCLHMYVRYWTCMTADATQWNKTVSRKPSSFWDPVARTLVCEHRLRKNNANITKNGVMISGPNCKYILGSNVMETSCPCRQWRCHHFGAHGRGPMDCVVTLRHVCAYMCAFACRWTSKCKEFLAIDVDVLKTWV